MSSYRSRHYRDCDNNSIVRIGQGILVRDLWDKELVQLSSELVDVVLLDVASLLQWAYLGQNTSTMDYSRRDALLYVDHYGSQPVQVSVRVQGFIQRADLCPLGDWTG